MCNSIHVHTLIKKSFIANKCSPSAELSASHYHWSQIPMTSTILITQKVAVPWELPKRDTETRSEHLLLEKRCQETCLRQSYHKPSIRKNRQQRRQAWKPGCAGLSVCGVWGAQGPQMLCLPSECLQVWEVSSINKVNSILLCFLFSVSVPTTLFSYVTPKKKGAPRRGDGRKGWLDDAREQGAFSRVTRITWVQVLITRINNFMKYYRLYDFLEYNLRCGICHYVSSHFL